VGNGVEQELVAQGIGKSSVKREGRGEKDVLTPEHSFLFLFPIPPEQGRLLTRSAAGFDPRKQDRRIQAAS